MYYDTTLSELSLQAGMHFIATASGQQKDEFDCVVLTMPVPQVLQLRGDITQILGKFLYSHYLGITAVVSAE